MRVRDKGDWKLDTEVRNKAMRVSAAVIARILEGQAVAKEGRGAEGAHQLAQPGGSTCLGVSLAPAPAIPLTRGVPVCLLATCLVWR